MSLNETKHPERDVYYKSKPNTMRRAYLRQFYTKDEQGNKSIYGEPRMLKRPERAKEWKELLQILNESKAQSIGWKNID